MALVLDRALHPAQRRRLAAQMPPQMPHEACLRPLGGGDGTTLIVTSAEHDLIPALFEDLQAPDWQARLASMRRLRAGKKDGVLELNQPIHRRFQIALFEAFCVQPGRPRLDPAKISGAGVVVRVANGASRAGWMKQGKVNNGWAPVIQLDADPDPALAATHPANTAMYAAIAALRGPPAIRPSETVHTLHHAPPEVCAAIGRTVLFAVIPVVSNETSDHGNPGIDYQALPGDVRAEMLRHFSEYLGARPQRSLPHAGELLAPEWNAMAADTMTSDPQLASFGIFLHQMVAELDALGTGAGATTLMTLMSQVGLTPARDDQGNAISPTNAASLVRAAAPILVNGEANAGNVHMPLAWPAVSDSCGAQLADAALACLSDAHRARVGPPAKFADDTTHYVARGFMRVAGHGDCPDKLVWSCESEPFRILPWWDGEGPGTTIALPSISQLKKVKPSVAFSMPPALANLLNGDIKALAKGEGSPGSTAGPQIAWLCSFSIPFITICAFIVLNIFLSLFNIVFNWMLYIKLCIPIPVPPAPKGDG